MKSVEMRTSVAQLSITLFSKYLAVIVFSAVTNILIFLSIFFPFIADMWNALKLNR